MLAFEALWILPQAFISGFAVFASLGHLSYLSGIPVQDLDYAGFSLVFGTWPVVLGMLPGGEHWVRLLLFNLFLLGIDSAFSFIEGFGTVLLDTRFFEHMEKWKLMFGLCLSGFLLSLNYATDAGLSFLDTIDFYINFVMLWVGFFECFGAGWVYGIEKTVHKCGRAATAMYMIANFGSVFLTCGIWFGVSEDDGGIWGGFVALIGFYLLFIALTALLLFQKIQEDPSNTWPSLIWEISFKNIFDLRKCIEPEMQWIPGVWCILIKQFLPQVLIILFINLAQSETDEGESMFGHYGNYPTRPFQVLGILTFVFTLFTFSIGMLFPQVYSALALPEGHAQTLEDETIYVDDGDKKEEPEPTGEPEPTAGDDMQKQEEGIPLEGVEEEVVA
jgi:hypothetical protein